jgi:hypothetical protein
MKNLMKDFQYSQFLMNPPTFFVLILSITFKFSAAQKFKPSIKPYDAIGILGGYHLKEGNSFIELGISRSATIHAQTAAYSLSSEFGIVENKNIVGVTASAWGNNLFLPFLSLGLASSYYSDFDNKRCLSFKPIIGIGAAAFQLVYEYDFMMIKPNYNFGGNNRIALRINIGLMELKDKI